MDWVRVIKKRGKDNYLVHRIFTPDSQDQWLTTGDLDEEAAGLNDDTNNQSGGDIWEITANWLLDTETFNEWMNQEDYEVNTHLTNTEKKVKLKKPLTSLKTLDDVLKKSSKHMKRSPSPAPPLNKKPKANASNVNSQGGSTRKRKHEEITSASATNGNSQEADLTKGMDTPVSQPLVEEVQIPKNANIKKENSEYQPYRNGTMVDLDEDNNQHSNEENKDPSLTSQMNGHHLTNGNSSAIPFNNNTNNLNSHSMSNGTAQSILEQEACEQTHHIIVPSYSAWFDYTCIHEVEKRALPEYFNGKNKSKTPEIYMGYRNFMIDTYRLNPGEYLSGTACRRNLPGDVCAIMRVHAFLEQWGLINYQVDYEARAAPLGPPCTSHFTVLADTPSGLAPITGPKPTTGVSVSSRQMMDFRRSSTTTTTSIVKSSGSTDDKEATLPSGDATKTVTSESTAASMNVENYGLNTKIEKKQSTTTSSGILVGNAIMRNNEWTDAEILLLLEGLEMYKDDWNKVCEHVGTRTQDECILKFLQLPIEDPYLDPTTTQFNQAPLGPLAYQPLPFSQTGNPVMSTVAFLASMVDPRIASAAAKAAIAEFTKMKDEVPPHLMEKHLKEVSQCVKDGKPVDVNYNVDKTGVAMEKEATEKEAEEAADKKKDAEKPEEAEAKDEAKVAEKSVEDKKESEMEVDTPATGDQAKTEEAKEKSDSTEVAKVASEVKAESTAEKSKTDGEVTTTTTTTTTTVLSSTTTTVVKETAPVPPAISEAELKNAAASALAAAAVKAKQLALNEEKKIKSTVSLLVETQLKKLEFKLRHFEELEGIMDRERENLEHQRQQLIQERQQFHLEQLRAAEFRQRQLAAQQLLNTGKVQAQPPVQPAPQQYQQQPMQVQQQQNPMPVAVQQVQQQAQPATSPAPVATAQPSTAASSSTTTDPAATAAQPMQQDPAPAAPAVQENPTPAALVAEPTPAVQTPAAAADPQATVAAPVVQQTPQQLPQSDTQAASVPTPTPAQQPMEVNASVPQAAQPQLQPVPQPTQMMYAQPPNQQVYNPAMYPQHQQQPGMFMPGQQYPPQMMPQQIVMQPNMPMPNGVTAPTADAPAAPTQPVTTAAVAAPEPTAASAAPVTTPAVAAAEPTPSAPAEATSVPKPAPESAAEPSTEKAPQTAEPVEPAAVAATTTSTTETPAAESTTTAAPVASMDTS